MIPLTKKLITFDIHLICFRLSQNLALVLAEYYITTTTCIGTMTSVCLWDEFLPEIENDIVLKLFDIIETLNRCITMFLWLYHHNINTHKYLERLRCLMLN